MELDKIKIAHLLKATEFHDVTALGQSWRELRTIYDGQTNPTTSDTITIDNQTIKDYLDAIERNDPINIEASYQVIKAIFYGEQIITEGLLAHWKHNEGSGLILNDYYGSNNGVVRAVESEFWNNTAPDGSACGTYDGIDDDVNEIGNGLVITDNISIVSCFYISDNTGRNCTFIAKTDPGTLPNERSNYGFDSEANDNEIRFYYYGNGSWQIYKTSDFNFSLNTWYIATATFTFGTGSSIKIYNGTTLCSGSWTTGNGNVAPSGTSQYVHLGTIANNGDAGQANIMNGRLGNQLLYGNKILSISEITQNYNALKYRYGK